MSISEFAFSGADRLGKAISRHAHWWNGSWRYNTTDMPTLWASLKTYLRTDYCLANGFAPGGGFGPVEVPLRGARSLVFFARAGEQRRVVRMYPVCEHRAAENQRTALVLLAEHGVLAPRLIHYLADLPKYRAIFLTEEFIVGETCRPGRMEANRIEKVGLQIARLHSIRNESWGPLASTHRGGMLPPLRIRIRRQFEILVKRGLATPKEWTAVHAWVEAWQSRLRSPQSYALLHGDLHANNGLFTPDGDYCLLDFSKLNWGFAAKDVVRLRDRVCGGDPELFKHFEQSYLSNLSSQHRAEYEATRPFFMALHELAIAAAETKKDARNSGVLRAQDPAETAAEALANFKMALSRRP